RHPRPSSPSWPASGIAATLGPRTPGQARAATAPASRRQAPGNRQRSISWELLVLRDHSARKPAPRRGGGQAAPAGHGIATLRNAMAARYRFDEFLLDTAERQLWRGTALLDVNGRYFDALALLVG